MPDLSRLGEAGIISLFDSGAVGHPVIRGIGDDCAAVRLGNGELQLLTTDLLVEGVHFRRACGSPDRLGAKALAVSLSDIAAMGGTAQACLLALSLPPELDESWLRAFRDGFTKTAEQYGCPIVGGDTCAGAGLVTIAVTVIGRSADAEILWRAGAADGDDIWIGGTPGLAALGLRILEAGGAGGSGGHVAAAEAVERHLSPVPQLELGRELAAGGLATSCIDTSDGIAIDLGHLCTASGLGAVLEENAIPLPSVPPDRDDDPLELALHGGEDYLLLFTANPGNRERLPAGRELHRIGRMVKSKKVVELSRTDGSRRKVTPGGYAHFPPRPAD